MQKFPIKIKLKGASKDGFVDLPSQVRGVHESESPALPKREPGIAREKYVQLPEVPATTKSPGQEVLTGAILSL